MWFLLFCMDKETFFVCLLCSPSVVINVQAWGETEYMKRHYVIRIEKINKEVGLPDNCILLKLRKNYIIHFRTMNDIILNHAHTHTITLQTVSNITLVSKEIDCH